MLSAHTVYSIALSECGFQILRFSPSPYSVVLLLRYFVWVLPFCLLLVAGGTTGGCACARALGTGVGVRVRVRVSFFSFSVDFFTNVILF